MGFRIFYTWGGERGGLRVGNFFMKVCLSLLGDFSTTMKDRENEWLNVKTTLCNPLHFNPISPAWKFLTRVWHLDLDSDIVTGLWYTHNPTFGSLSWFWRCKDHPCPLSPHLGLWRMLVIPNWGLVYLSWFGYGHWSLIQPWSEF